MAGRATATENVNGSAAIGNKWADQVRSRAIELRKKRWTIVKISRTLGPGERTLRRWFREAGLPAEVSARGSNRVAIEQQLRNDVPVKKIARMFKCSPSAVYQVRRRMNEGGVVP